MRPLVSNAPGDLGPPPSVTNGGIPLRQARQREKHGEATWKRTVIDSWGQMLGGITNTGLNSGLDTTASDYVARASYQPNSALTFTSRFRFRETDFTLLSIPDPNGDCVTQGQVAADLTHIERRSNICSRQVGRSGAPQPVVQLAG